MSGYDFPEQDTEVAPDLEARPRGSWSSAHPTGPRPPPTASRGQLPWPCCLARPRFLFLAQLPSRVRRVEEEFEDTVERWLTQVNVSGSSCSEKFGKCFRTIRIARCLCSANPGNGECSTTTPGSDTFPRAKRPWSSLFLPCRPRVLSYPISHV